MQLKLKYILESPYEFGGELKYLKLFLRSLVEPEYYSNNIT